MIDVSHPERVVYPEVGKTKADVVAYYAQIAPRALPHLLERPLSIRRYPKGLAEPGFFQKNVPAHYPATIRRFGRPRSHDATKKHKKAASDVTLYPLVDNAEQLAYLANQGALELHVPVAQAPAIDLPDRFVMDLDPPAGERALVRRAALVVREALAHYGLPSVPIATGSKGYHVVAAIEPQVDSETLSLTAQKFATLVAAEHAKELTVAYRIAQREGRVFLDWLRNRPHASVVAPYSLRATARATVAVPLGWTELMETDPDAFVITDVEQLLTRPDSLLELARAPADTRAFVARVEQAFADSKLVLEPFDRFRS